MFISDDFLFFLVSVCCVTSAGCRAEHRCQTFALQPAR